MTQLGRGDWQGFRKLMPVTERWAYLDHAAVAPLPEPTRRAMAAWLDQATTEGDTVWPEWAAALESLRQLAAGMIGASPQEIALIPNTTTGISLVAEGFPWRDGDNIVTLANEFPSNLYPWLNLADRGVAVRQVPVTNGQVDYRQLADACDARTRIVSTSWVGYASGFRLDVERVSRIAHQHQAFFFLDAIQGLGVFPLDVRSAGVDFLAADGHKWMLGPEGAGLLFIREDLLSMLRPLGVGWNSVVHRYDFGRIDLQLRESAARYEGGSMNMIGFRGLLASLTILSQLGVAPHSSTLADRVDELSAEACDMLQRSNAYILSPQDIANRTGIIVFQVSEHEPESIRQACRTAGLAVSCRGGGVRISLHAYNDRHDIQRLADVLRELSVPKRTSCKISHETGGISSPSQHDN